MTFFFYEAMTMFVESNPKIRKARCIGLLLDLWMYGLAGWILLMLERLSHFHFHVSI